MESKDGGNNIEGGVKGGKRDKGEDEGGKAAAMEMRRQVLYSEKLTI
jgi:hypothetical protein